jgi:transcriptional regulator with XRE-family HTH domain
MDQKSSKSSNYAWFIFVDSSSTMAKKVYNKIKAIIAEEGKSNKELAELLHVSEQTVSRWCTNSRQPSIEMLYEIAKVLRRDVRDFLVPNK